MTLTLTHFASYCEKLRALRAEGKTLTMVLNGQDYFVMGVTKFPDEIFVIEQGDRSKFLDIPRVRRVVNHAVFINPSNRISIYYKQFVPT